MKHTTVKQALTRALNGTPSSVGEDVIDMPMHEMIALKLVEMANNPDNTVRGGVAKAARAQRMVLDRTVGKRLPGTSPVGLAGGEIEFADLTTREIDS